MNSHETTYKVSAPGQEPVIVTGSEKLDIVQAALVAGMCRGQASRGPA